MRRRIETLSRGFEAAVKCLLFSLCACSAAAQGTVQVVPGGLANVEGNSGTTNPFGTGGSYYQQVFASSEFASIGAPTGQITDIWFRLDQGSTSGMFVDYSVVDLFLSTTARSPDSLAPVFADNHGGDLIRVYSTGRNVSADFSPGSQPQPFLIRFQLQTPFFYSPSQGNLLLDIRTIGGTFNPANLDAQSVLGDSLSRVVANSGNSLNGAPDTTGLAVRFDMVPVPEPTLGRVCFLCLALILFSRVQNFRAKTKRRI